VVHGVDLVHEVVLEGVPVAAGDHLVLVPEVVQDVGRVGARGVRRRVAALVLGRDVWHPAGELDQLGSAVVGLAHDALVGLCDVVLEPDGVLEAERPADPGGGLEGPVVDRVAPVEPDERSAAVIAREQLRRQEHPEP
jgi:hypothetical protein